MECYVERIQWLVDRVECPESSADFYDYYNEYCEAFGAVSRETYKRYCRKAFNSFIPETGERVKTVYTKDGMTAEMKASDIRTEEDLYEFGQIDRDKWECTKLINEFWGNEDHPNYLIKGEYKLRTPGMFTPSEYAEKFKALVKDVPTPSFEVRNHKETGNIYEICLFDIHFGQLSWAAETGDMDYNLDVAAKLFMKAIDYFVAETHHDAEKYVLPLGNDLLNVDTPLNTTTKGTPQAECSRPHHTFLEAEKLLIKAITKLHSIAEVEVVIVPGNHDNTRMFYIGEFLRAYFRDTTGITIDNSPTDRKYLKLGKVLLGYTHGSEEVRGTLPMLMAQENPMAFATTKYHEWHLGHWHSAHDKHYRVSRTHNGIVEEVIPSLVPLDDYHKRKGYYHFKQCVCYKWNKETGKKAKMFFGID